MTPIESLARDVLDRARMAGMMVATAESCTGGLVAGALTDIPGSSDVLDRGFVTYTNAAKVEMLDVVPETLDTFGAVSEQVARQMATGALAHSQAQIAVSITGVAGPGGGSLEKPVGLVWFGLAVEGSPIASRMMQFGDIGRAEVRAGSVDVALNLLRDAL